MIGNSIHSHRIIYIIVITYDAWFGYLGVSIAASLKSME